MAEPESLNSFFPTDSPGDWDLTIDGRALSFRKVLVAVDGFDASSKLDVKDADGVNGASIDFKGYSLAKGTIRLSAWNQEGQDLILAVIDLVRPRPKQAKLPAFSVYHPTLASLYITSLVVESVSGLQRGTDGLVFTSLKCVEFAPPPAKAKAKPKTPIKLAEPGSLLDGPGAAPPYGPPPPPKPSAAKPKP